MFITPIEKIGSLEEINKVGQASASNRVGGEMFQNIFSNAIQNVTETDKSLTQSQYLLSVGEVDDVHTQPIAAAKAQLSVDLLVQLRNKALDAYNEMIRMSV